MKRLWAPWRIKYITEGRSGGCLFCEKAGEGRDRENYILYRGGRCFIMLNIYPYNNGHLMIAPYRHLASIEDLDYEECSELMELAKRCLKALREAMKAEGFNIGVNVGRVAGAGVEDHVHLHIIPRWLGDTSFMPIIAETKVMNEALSSTYEKLLKLFK